MNVRDDEIERLRSELEIARRHIEARSFERAEPVFRRALLFFHEGEDLRLCLENLRLLYSGNGNYGEATEMTMRLLALNENEFGKTDERTISVMNDLAALLLKQGQTQKGERMRQKALEREVARISRLASEKDDPDQEHGDDGSKHNQSSASSRLKSENSTGSFRPDQVNDTLRLRSHDHSDPKGRLQAMLAKIASELRNDYVRSFLQSVFFIIFLLVVNNVIQGLPRNPSPIEVFVSFPHSYLTSDGEMRLDFVNQVTAVFETRPKKRQTNELLTESPKELANRDASTMPMSQFLNDWRDAVSIMIGSILERQYWVQRAGDRLVDQDNRTYYAIDGPESKLIDEMRLIQSTVRDYYNLKGHYPAVISESLVSSYKNPYTEETMRPNCQTVVLGDSTASESSVMSQRDTLYASIRRGFPWPNEQPPKPGAINCCLVVFESQTGETRDFLIRAVGRDSCYLATSIPGVNYLVSLNNQKQFSPEAEVSLPLSGSAILRPRRVWLLNPSADEQERHLLRYGAAYLFAFIAVMYSIALVLQYQIHGFRKGFKRSVFNIVCFFLLAIFGAISRFLP